MQSLNVHTLCQFVRDLRSFELEAFQLTGVTPGLVTEADEKVLQPILALCDGATEFFYLPATAARRARTAEAVSQRVPYAELQRQLTALRESLEDELANRLVLFMPSNRAVHYYAGERLLGDDVLAKFPTLASDIGEAAQCLACGRFTATVFHLMRVMEAGVQAFGAKLGVKFSKPKVWQVVLNEANAAIKKLPSTDAMRPKFSALSSSLWTVKTAWRNPVMHPKTTYTEDEAEKVVHATKAFMGELAVLL